MELNCFFNDRNRPLWENINPRYKIIIEEHPYDHFYHRLMDEEIVLFIPEQNGTTELFTHELLHLYLLSRGITITKYLKDRLRNEPLLHWSFNENLFEQVGNCFEHNKMLSLYLSMGFERDLFIETYYMPSCTEMNMQIIKSGMSKETPAKASVDMFILKFFAMKANLNPHFAYTGYLEKLEMINSELYAILEKFWKSWSAFDIENDLSISFKSFTYEFMHELGTWNILNVYTKQNVRA